MLLSISFQSNMNLRSDKLSFTIFTHRDGTRPLKSSNTACQLQHSVSRHLMRTSTEFIIYISAPTISTFLDFCDLVKGRLMCIVLCSNIVQITTHVCAFSSRFLVTPRHQCVIMHEVVDESPRKYGTINRL